ncbi:hypothetical protein [Terrisporobacter petrolearius]|uniref:hypothetical protein n=1 Tax=Terrisporobacter petrolearius TaxID=1460447 RepID=UPI001D16F6BD|nr:hypothetical protein [Terrisporobacter petrolearius]
MVTKKEECETIGCVSVICSDKTEILTKNKMILEDSYIDGKYIGSATECALLLYHIDKDYKSFRKNTNLLSQVPFSSEKKLMG